MNKVTEMLNSDMILPGNSDIMLQLILRKTWVGGICKQCNKVIETMSHMVKGEKTKEYLNKLELSWAKLSPY